MWLEEARKLNGPMQGFSHNERVDTPRTNEGMRINLQGDETHVKKAQSIVKQLSINIETPRNEWYREQYGYFPDVDAYVQGQPQDMWMQRTIHEDRSPIKMWVGLTSSAMIDERDLISRGAAISAFVIAMSNIRPVVLVPFVTLGSSRRANERAYTYDSIGRRRQDKSHRDDANWGVRNMIISWNISTQPLILSEVMALTRPEVCRYMGIEACRHLFGQDASEDPSFHHDSFDEDKMRQHLNAAPDDLYLPPLHGYDPLISNPVKWIQDQITRYTSGETTDMAIKPTEF